MRLVVFSFVVCGLVAAIPRPAFAQDPVNPAPGIGQSPFAGLFGSSRDPLQQSLSLLLSASGGIDDNVDPRNNPNNPTPGVSSGFGQGSARLAYQLNRGTVGASGVLGGSLAHYTRLAGSRVARRHANGHVWWQIPLTARTNISLSADGQYQPFLLIGRFPLLIDPEPHKVVFTKIGDALFEQFGQVIDIGLGPTSAVIDPGSPTESINHVRWVTRAQLNHNLTRRLSFSADYGYGGTDTTFDDATHRSQHVSGTFVYSLTRDLGLRVGYAEMYHRSTLDGVVTSHRTSAIDAGLQFHRALSLTQSTTLSFGTNTNAYSQNDRTRYRLNGNVELSQQITRSWQASLDVRRQGEYVPAFGAPAFSDSLRAGLNGLVGTRLQVQSGIGVRRGHVGFNPTGTRFESYFATAGLQAALSRYISAGASYGYYRYDFESGVTLPSGVSSRVMRQSVQGFVNVWVPLLQQRRRS
jgi:hypothetical protein